MDILPNLTPEHAALLGQSERQRLAAELNSSYENLNQMVQEHDSTEDQWDECYEQDAEWYMFCFEVGLAAHLADAITTRAESLPQSEDNIEIARDAVGKCCQAAQESMEYVRKNEPHADAPFPQTRQQSMERALNDCVKLGVLGQRLQEKLEAVQQEADNSLGRCHLCGKAIRAEHVSTHALSCVTAAVQWGFVNNDLNSSHAVRHSDTAAYKTPNQYVQVLRWMEIPGQQLLKMNEPPFKPLRNLSDKPWAYSTSIDDGKPEDLDFDIQWKGIVRATIAGRDFEYGIKPCALYYPQLFYGY